MGYELPEESTTLDVTAPGLPATFFRTVVETANEGIWMIDAEGRTTFANPRMERMLGVGPGEMLGRHPRDYLLDGDLEMASMVIRETLSGHPQEFEPRFRHSGGAEIPTLGSTAPILDEDGKIVGAVATFSDLTDRKAAEQALLQREREAKETAGLLNQLLEAATDAIWMRDLSGVFRVANPAACTVMGGSHEEIVGRSMHDIWGPEVGAHLAQEAERIFSLGHGISVEEEMFDAGRGGPTIFMSNKVPIYSADGAPLGILGISRDITERKRDENELRESRAQLGQQVADLQVAQQREQLLAREVDHRAKNLLAVVQSVVQLTRASSTEELKEAIVGRIQSLARAHALLADSRWEGVELTQLVSEELAPFADEGSLQATFSGPPVRLRPAAAQSLALILHELATNAAKYGALSSREGMLEVRWSAERDPWILELDWVERMASPVSEPVNAGFGSRIIRTSVERQLRGKLTQQWLATGLNCRIEFPLDQASDGTSAGTV